jgi:ankyrin repeat protein
MKIIRNLIFSDSKENRDQKTNFVFMSELRRIFIKCILISGLLLSTGLLKGQWELIRPNSSSIDTSGYIPAFYNGALDYNLLIAASNGYPSEIERLIKKGADIEAETNEGATPLVLAVSSNKLLAVNALLSFQPDVNKVTRSYETPLMIAVKFDYELVAEKLIRAGAEVNFKDLRRATPLHYAALYGYLALTDLLIYYDADTESRTIDGSTPLHGAIAAGNNWVADLLVQRGADIEVKDNQGLTPFLIAAFYGDTVLMEMLRGHGADIYALNLKNYDALTITIIAGQYEAANYLLSIGSWPAKGAIDPYTVAAKYNRKDMIKLLTDYKVPGKMKYSIDQASLSVSERISPHDAFTGISLTFREPLRNIGIIAGVDTKFFPTRVLYKSQEEHTYYQFYDKGSLAYLGVFKDFRLKYYKDLSAIYFTSSLSAGFSLGNNLRGSTMKTDNSFKVIPAAGFRWTKMHLSIDLGIQYTDTKFYKTGPIWIRAGVSYNYFFDEIRSKIKPISWYK